MYPTDTRSLGVAAFPKRQCASAHYVGMCSAREAKRADVATKVAHACLRCSLGQMPLARAILSASFAAPPPQHDHDSGRLPVLADHVDLLNQFASAALTSAQCSHGTTAAGCVQQPAQTASHDRHAIVEHGTVRPLSHAESVRTSTGPLLVANTLGSQSMPPLHGWSGQSAAYSLRAER
jgi:hypothetical protein